mgnify:CR=1 FL=1
MTNSIANFDNNTSNANPAQNTITPEVMHTFGEVLAATALTSMPSGYHAAATLMLAYRYIVKGAIAQKDDQAVERLLVLYEQCGITMRQLQSGRPLEELRDQISKALSTAGYDSPLQ